MPTKQELEAEAAAKDLMAKDIAAKEAEAKLKAAADEKAKADAASKAAEEAKRTEGLIKMQRGESIIHAHPTTIKDHEKNGWKVA